MRRRPRSRTSRASRLAHACCLALALAFVARADDEAKDGSTVERASTSSTSTVDDASPATMNATVRAISETLMELASATNASMAAAAYEEALRELGGTTNGTAARIAANAVEAGDYVGAGEALASAVVGLVNSTVGDDTAAAFARALEAMGDETRGAATKDADEDEDADEASSDLETYLLDTSSPKTSRARAKLVEPIEEEYSSDDVRAVGVVLADVGRSYGESSVTRTLARFAARRNAVVVRPGTCSGKPISCTGACVVDKDSVASQLKALGGGKSARLGGFAVGSARGDWMSTVAEEDSRWIGEVAHPVQFAFERMYRAARHYITSGDAEFAPVPELESCSNFTESLDVLRKKCASMRCKTGFADMQKYITATQKKTILGCPGFTSNPQTTRLRGTTVENSETPSSAERRTRAKYAALVPIGSPEKENESLVALTYSFDFKLSDLVFHRTSREMQDDAYDVSKEPKELRESVEGGNKIDLKLFNKVEAQIEDAKAQDTFASRLEALRGMSAAADLFCLENKVCTTGRAATKVIDIDPVHASTLGAFPASCGTEEVAKEIKCVEDWFLCDGPDASGSVWHAGTVSTKSQDVAAAGQTEKTSEKSSKNTTTTATATATATATTTTTTTTAKSVDDDGDADGPSTAETGDGKEAAESKPKPTATATAAPTKSVAFQAAANVHRQSPWLWYSIVFILFAVILASYAHSYLESANSARPASSLELGASIVRAEREVSAKKIGREMSANDEFWKSASHPSSPPTESARGTGLDSGTAGRRPGRSRARVVRGPMTAEERAFYDEL